MDLYQRKFVRWCHVTPLMKKKPSFHQLSVSCVIYTGINGDVEYICEIWRDRERQRWESESESERGGGGKERMYINRVDGN